MGELKKRAKNYFIYGAFAILWAGIFGVFSYMVLFLRVAGEKLLYAYILNIIFILVCLVADRMAFALLKRKKATLSRRGFRALLRRIFFTKYNMASFKSALYIFHVFTMILSQALIFNAPFEVSGSFHNYLHAIEPGLLLLVIFDIFIEQIASDDKQIGKLTGE
jgi:steroid 5-alpha reductase family enzyme